MSISAKSYCLPVFARAHLLKAPAFAGSDWIGAVLNGCDKSRGGGRRRAIGLSEGEFNVGCEF